jgi:transposase
MRPQGSPEKLEQRRYRAIELLSQGYQPVEVARMVEVDRRSVRRWKAAYRERGREGLNRKPAPGRPPKLDTRACKKLERALLKGARAAGFATDLWTCPRVAKLIKSRFGVQYHVDHIGRVLRSLGWTPQKPQRRAVERNEETIRGWLKKQWPRIKKSLAPEGAACVSRRKRHVDGATASAFLGAAGTDTDTLSAHVQTPEGIRDCLPLCGAIS